MHHNHFNIFKKCALEQEKEVKMFYQARNGSVKVGDADMDYITFGKGTKVFVMIPGLGDGLRTVKGMAASFALMYRVFAKKYKVYIFSRKNRLSENESTKDMARDTIEAMRKLGIYKACVMGVSQGGMIAQHMAIDYPDVVEKLVLAVTESRCNETVEAMIGNWIQLARKKDYATLFIDTAEKSYSEKKLRFYRHLYPVLTRIGVPKDYERFLIQANACIQHNAYDELERIECNTLVICGGNDKVVGTDASREIAKKIKDSTLIVYEGLGHMAFEETKDFNVKVLDFLDK